MKWYLEDMRPSVRDVPHMVRFLEEMQGLGERLTVSDAQRRFLSHALGYLRAREASPGLSQSAYTAQIPLSGDVLSRALKFWTGGMRYVCDRKED
jgi:hypothetical protein